LFLYTLALMIMNITILTSLKPIVANKNINLILSWVVFLFVILYSSRAIYNQVKAPKSLGKTLRRR
jgi:hypothetical protein